MFCSYYKPIKQVLFHYYQKHILIITPLISFENPHYTKCEIMFFKQSYEIIFLRYVLTRLFNARGTISYAIQAFNEPCEFLVYVWFDYGEQKYFMSLFIEYIFLVSNKYSNGIWCWLTSCTKLRYSNQIIVQKKIFILWSNLF